MNTCPYFVLLTIVMKILLKFIFYFGIKMCLKLPNFLTESTCIAPCVSYSWPSTLFACEEKPFGGPPASGSVRFEFGGVSCSRWSWIGWGRSGTSATSWRRTCSSRSLPLSCVSTLCTRCHGSNQLRLHCAMHCAHLYWTWKWKQNRETRRCGAFTSRSHVLILSGFQRMVAGKVCWHLSRGRADQTHSWSLPLEH